MPVHGGADVDPLDLLVRRKVETAGPVEHPAFALAAADLAKEARLLVQVQQPDEGRGIRKQGLGADKQQLANPLADIGEGQPAVGVERHPEHGTGYVLGDGAQLGLPLAQAPQCRRALRLQLGLAEGAPNGRGQAGKVRLEHIIERPRIHRLGGILLADVAGNDEEGHVRHDAVDDAEDGHGIEIGDVMLGDDHVPEAFPQGGTQAHERVHPPPRQLHARRGQMVDQGLGFIIRAVDQQDPDQIILEGKPHTASCAPT